MTITISDNRDLKFAYGLLKVYKECYACISPIKGDDHAEIINLKRAIREYTRREPAATIFNSTFEGWTEKVEMPFDTIEECEEYFQNCMYIEPYYTYYDCTGRPFTAWHSIVKMHGTFVCYHRIDYDI